jgi:plasmid stabilization system protein ParE
VAQKRLIWSATALADVEAIAAFVARDSERYASAVVERMLEAAASLSELSERGRVVPETAEESIREVFVYSWRVIYRVQPSTVTILTVVHQKQLLDPGTERFRRT